MPSRTPLSPSSTHAISLGAMIVSFGFIASGCASLPPGLFSGAPTGGGGGSLTGGASPGVVGGQTAPVPAPTPAVTPASPPDFVVPPPAGAVDPVPLQPGSGTGDPVGGGQPVAWPGGGGGLSPSPASTTAPGQGSFLPDQEAVVLQLTNQARAQA